jgi:hypothetical protein
VLLIDRAAGSHHAPPPTGAGTATTPDASVVRNSTVQVTHRSQTDSACLLRPFICTIFVIRAQMDGVELGDSAGTRD